VSGVRGTDSRVTALGPSIKAAEAAHPSGISGSSAWPAALEQLAAAAGAARPSAVPIAGAWAAELEQLAEMRGAAQSPPVYVLDSHGALAVDTALPLGMTSLLAERRRCGNCETCESALGFELSAAAVGGASPDSRGERAAVCASNGAPRTAVGAVTSKSDERAATRAEGEGAGLAASTGVGIDRVAGVVEHVPRLCSTASSTCPIVMETIVGLVHVARSSPEWSGVRIGGGGARARFTGGSTSGGGGGGGGMELLMGECRGE